jgi:outer membrane receptor protein involved in Fe transport
MQSKLIYLLRVVVTAVLLAGNVAPLFAQNATGAINGTVKDQNGAVIANAVVTAKNKATGSLRNINAGNDGLFAFENLPPGEYEVKVEAQGFATQTLSVLVQVGNATTSNFGLSVGAVNQVVDVTGGPPVINATESSLGGVVNQRQIQELPLNGRSFLSVAGLEPGVNVNYVATSGPGNNNNFFQVSIAGAPQSMTVITVDGARTNDRVTGGTSQNFSAETVQEFQISTFGFDLSTGTVSAGAVNIVSRSGTNNFHGSGFYFYRDNDMAAYPSFTRDPKNPSPFFERKQYGGTFGGPIKKNKLFVFSNYERSDQVGAQTIQFSDPLLTGLNHVGELPFDQHLANVRLDYQVSQDHTAFFRTSMDRNDSISGGGNLESTWTASDNDSYQTQFGLTSVFTSKLVNDFRTSYSYFRNYLNPPTQAQCERVAKNPLYCFGVGGPRITFFGGVTIGNDTNVPQSRYLRTYQFTDNISWTKGSHRVRFGGNLEHSYGHGSWNRNDQGSFAVFAPTAVAASTAPGAQALYAALSSRLKPGSTETPTFADLLSLPINGTLSIGIGDGRSPVNYERQRLLRNNHVRFYGQDAWQIVPRFTLNYGVGWSFENNQVFHDLDRPEYVKPLGIALGKLPYDYNNFDPALGFAWSPNDKTVIRGSASVHHASLNIGFFKLNDRLLISPAGAGISQLTSAAVTNPKFLPGNGQPQTLNFTTPVAFTGAELLNLIPSLRGVLGTNLLFTGKDLSVRNIEISKTAAGPQNLDVLFDENYKTPYTVHINFGVQREVVRNLSVSADFVMRRGVKFGALEGQFIDRNLWNRFTHTVAPNGTAIPTRRPVLPACTATQRNDPKAQCSNGPILYAMPGILSRYTALQLKVDKRFGNGFQLTGSYALARYTTFTGTADFNDYSKGFGDAGIPKHQFSFSGIWNLPKYNGEQKIVRALVNNWQVSSIMQMATGGSNSVSLGTLDPEGDGTFVFRLPGTSINSFGRSQTADDIRRYVEQYNATFAAPKNALPNQIPSSQRDAVGTPFPYIILPNNFAASDSFLTHDLRLTRTIPIKEKVRLNLIAEGFNIFNIANLTGYSGTLNAYVRPTATTPGRDPNLTFGQPTGRVSPIFGTGGPRAFQLAARVSF